MAISRRATRRFWRYLRAERRTLPQGFVALVHLARAGTSLAGLTLSFMDNDTPERFPASSILIPAAIGMRGNIFGALGARLGTDDRRRHVRGQPPPGQRPAPERYIGAWYLTLATCLFLGSAAHVVARCSAFRADSRPSRSELRHDLDRRRRARLGRRRVVPPSGVSILSRTVAGGTSTRCRRPSSRRSATSRRLPTLWLATSSCCNDAGGDAVGRGVWRRAVYAVGPSRATRARRPSCGGSCGSRSVVLLIADRSTSRPAILGASAGRAARGARAAHPRPAVPRGHERARRDLLVADLLEAPARCHHARGLPQAPRRGRHRHHVRVRRRRSSPGRGSPRTSWRRSPGRPRPGSPAMIAVEPAGRLIVATDHARAPWPTTSAIVTFRFGLDPDNHTIPIITSRHGPGRDRCASSSLSSILGVTAHG